MACSTASQFTTPGSRPAADVAESEARVPENEGSEEVEATLIEGLMRINPMVATIFFEL